MLLSFLTILFALQSCYIRLKQGLLMGLMANGGTVVMDIWSWF